MSFMSVFYVMVYPEQPHSLAALGQFHGVVFRQNKHLLDGDNLIGFAAHILHL